MNAAADPALGARLASARKALADGRLDEADALVCAVLDAAPEHRDALYLVAVVRRYQGRLAESLGALSELTRIAPDYGRAWQERGHTLKALDDPELAAECYAQAVALNPALAASWNALAELRHAAGDTAGETTARDEARRLAAMARPVAVASSLFHEGDVARAEDLLRRHLKRVPDDVEAMRLLAAIGLELDVLDDAEFLLRSALEFRPDFAPARFDLVNVLHRRQKFPEACDEARRLVSARPGDPAARFALASEQAAVGDYDSALAGFDEAIAAWPDRPGYHVARAHALRQLGRSDDAVASYLTAIDRQPDFGDAWWSLANLKTYRFDADQIARMRALEANDRLRGADRIPLAFALGKAHEDLGEDQAAFAFYDRGNRLKRERSRYRPETTTAAVDAQIAHVTPDFVEALARSGGGAAASDPIFVVGLPRSGSTLIEQILASHPDVDGTTEFHEIMALAHRLSRRDGDGPGYPAVLAALTDDERAAYGEAYLDATRFLREGAPRFVDKMPNNFLHLGLIHAILPNARIVDVRRDPMGACFANFKQLFGQGQEFTYGLEHIGRYYRDYLRLMRHTRSVLPPETILTVCYEDVVGDLEGTVRRLLEFLGLPFDAACLEFHQTERAVRTPSSEQVRQPIYTGGLEQWRRFEPWLGPLRETLGPLTEPGIYREY